MWLTPEPSKTYANVNLPDSSPIRHRSISCLAPTFPTTPNSESKRTPKSNRPRKTSGATRVSDTRLRSVASPEGASVLPLHPNLNGRQSSDPGNFLSAGFPLADRLSTPTSTPQWGRMVENSEDRSRRELESPRVTGPQVRAVQSPHPRHGFRPPSLSSRRNG